MTRYATRAAWVDGWHNEGRPDTMDVHCFEDDAPRETGILGASGMMIYRMPEPKKVGFDLRPRVRVKAKGVRL